MKDFFAITTPEAVLKATTDAGDLAKHPTRRNIEKAKAKLGRVVKFFETNKKPGKPLFHDVTKGLLFDVFKGSLDAYNLLRVCDYLDIKLTDEVRSEIIAAYIRSYFPNVDMHDIDIVAAGRKSTNGKITADEYKQWANRALITGYPSPTWKEALDIATRNKDEADRAPYVRKMLREDIAAIRDNAKVIKDLKVNTMVYVDILADYIRSGEDGLQKAVNVENALELGADTLGKALQKAYPLELFEPAEEQTNDTPSEAPDQKQSSRWRFKLSPLLRRKSHVDPDATATAEAPAVQQPDKAAA